MPKQPRRPRAIKRGTDAEPERVASRIITAHLDLRQAGLFDLPATWIAPAIPTLVREAPRGPIWPLSIVGPQRWPPQKPMDIKARPPVATIAICA